MVPAHVHRLDRSLPTIPVAHSCTVIALEQHGQSLRCSTMLITEQRPRLQRGLTTRLRLFIPHGVHRESPKTKSHPGGAAFSIRPFFGGRLSDPVDRFNS